GSAQVDGNGLVPLIRKKVVDRSPDTVDARIGDHDIQSAVTGNQTLDRRSYLIFFRDVSRQSDGLAAGSFDLVADPLHLAFSSAESADPCAFRGEFQCACPSDSGTGTGYERNFSGKFHMLLLRIVRSAILRGHHCNARDGRWFRPGVAEKE